MAQISVSLEVIQNIDHRAALPGTTTLAQILPGFQGRVPALDDAVFVVSYRIAEPESALYELGVRTGDIFMLVADSDTDSAAVPHDQLAVGMSVLRPSGDVLEVSDYATVGDILRHLNPLTGGRAATLYIGRYAPNAAVTLDDLGLASGDLISLAFLPTRLDYDLLLIPSKGGFTPFRVTESAAVLGGSHSGAQVALDVSHILPRRKRHLIQGPQVEFMRENESWYVQVLPGANVPVFVDSQRLFPHRQKALFENHVISLGSSPNEPLLQLVVQFDVE